MVSGGDEDVAIGDEEDSLFVDEFFSTYRFKETIFFSFRNFKIFSRINWSLQVSLYKPLVVVLSRDVL